MTTNPRLFSFVGGHTGPWRVMRASTITGETWPAASRVAVHAGDTTAGDGEWVLRGVTSNERYVTKTEKADLVAKQKGLGRPASRCAALIPIKKSAAWWALTQDERRAVFEEQSAHIQIGLRYLPAIARRLHHCRDLGSEEPFDFLTWFEFAPEETAAFDALLVQLRASPEWTFVAREVELRLERVEE